MYTCLSGAGPLPPENPTTRAEYILEQMREHLSREPVDQQNMQELLNVWLNVMTEDRYLKLLEYFKNLNKISLSSDYMRKYYREYMHYLMWKLSNQR